MPKLQTPVIVDKGFVDLPREILVEALLFQNNMLFTTGKSTGRNEYFYYCLNKECCFRIKIIEKAESRKDLTLNSLINNFKSYDFTKPSELETGMSQIFQYGSHTCERNEAKAKEYVEKKEGTHICFLSS